MLSVFLQIDMLRKQFVCNNYRRLSRDQTRFVRVNINTKNQRLHFARLWHFHYENESTLN